MASTCTSLTCHIVFSIKYRRRTTTARLREEPYRTIGGILRTNNGELTRQGLLAVAPPGLFCLMRIILGLTPQAIRCRRSAALPVFSQSSSRT